MTVEKLLKDDQIEYLNVRLGEVILANDPSKQKIDKFSVDLRKVGFELLDDQKKKQIEKIKNLLIEKIQHSDFEERFSLGKYLSKELHKDYSHLSKLFTEVEGITIEQFFILQKIEKAKEWLVYDEYSLNQIAWKLNYSSVQHLSTQFKKVTGMTPTEFKKIGIDLRKPLDNLKRNDNLKHN